MRCGRLLLGLGLIALLFGCQQDSYQFPTLYSDAAGFDGAVEDGYVLGDGWWKKDGRGDGPGDGQAGGECIPRPEICNNIDDNCDGVIDEGFDKLNDPRYCEECKGCSWLLQKNAYPGCSNGKCTILACMPGWVQKDKTKVENGCDYQCTPTGVEICDGLDNDCDGTIDVGVTPPPGFACKTLGPCASHTIECKGAAGWQCVYGPTVELQPCKQDADCGAGYKCDTTLERCPGVVALQEELCDGIDGNCDGLVDDPWVNPAFPAAIGKSCDPDDPPKKGICRSQGVYACDPTAPKKGTVCKLTVPGKQPAPETCNGLDDDCDGIIDNNLTDEKWVKIGSGTSAFEIFVYEASRPDASATSAGVMSNGRPCSVPTRLPWSVVTKEAANAACQLAGGSLCTTAQWMQACKGSAGTTYPYGNTFDATKCNGNAYDIDPAAPGIQSGPLTTEKPSTCTSSWGTAGSILNMSGNVKEWTKSSSSSSGYDLMGGAYDTPSVDTHGLGLSCDYVIPAPSTMLQFPTIGFRCCK